MISRNPDQLFNEVDGEVVMLNIDKSEYYSLNSIGSFIWKQLKEPKSIIELIHCITEEYDVSYDECLKDIEPFFETVIDKGLLQIIDE